MPRGTIYFTDDDPRGGGYIRTEDGRRIRFEARNAMGFDTSQLTHKMDVDFVERGKSGEALIVRPAQEGKK
jgi:hypothetical protein